MTTPEAGVPDRPPTPYERLGETGLRDLIADFYASIRSDKQLAPFFAGTDMAHLLSMQHEYLRVAFGDTPAWSGRSLQEVHAGRGIGEHEYARFMELMNDALERAGVSAHDIDLVIQRMQVAATDILGASTEAG